MKKIIVAAMTEERVIGSDGDIPWHYPKDLKHFKELTMGSPVVMGRKTFFSLPEQYRPLPGRKNIIISNSDPELPENVFLAKGLEEAWEKAGEKSDKVFIIGGSSIYRQTLNEADEMELTIIHENYEGDRYFPDWDENDWVKIREKEEGDLSFLTYRSSSKS
ncbi:MAG: dihydrofolate reductase [Nanohaloarchaea archaeon]|nr:dihydrofolate reductase [Candidatus Nanohaloarchaea archaeon]